MTVRERKDRTSRRISGGRVPAPVIVAAGAGGETRERQGRSHEGDGENSSEGTR